MYFDLEALQKFHLYWRDLETTESRGYLDDLAFMKEDEWLKDSAVIDRIQAFKGQWTVSLVFADPARKGTFIVRYIRNNCPTYKKAVVTAGFMRRVAAKDPRGTIEIDPGDYNLPLN